MRNQCGFSKDRKHNYNSEGSMKWKIKICITISFKHILSDYLEKATTVFMIKRSGFEHILPSKEILIP